MIITMNIIHKKDKELYLDMIAGFIARGLLFNCTVEQEKATITFTGGH